MEHILRYDHVYSRYAEAGIEVFAFDQRVGPLRFRSPQKVNTYCQPSSPKGFGQTAAQTDTRGQTSWPEGLSDIEFIVKQEASSPTVKVFLMGHSMVSLDCFSCRIPTVGTTTSSLSGRSHTTA